MAGLKLASVKVKDKFCKLIISVYYYSGKEAPVLSVQPAEVCSVTGANFSRQTTTTSLGYDGRLVKFRPQ